MDIKDHMNYNGSRFLITSSPLVQAFKSYLMNIPVLATRTFSHTDSFRVSNFGIRSYSMISGNSMPLKRSSHAKSWALTLFDLHPPPLASLLALALSSRNCWNSLSCIFCIMSTTRLVCAVSPKKPNSFCTCLSSSRCARGERLRVRYSS